MTRFIFIFIFIVFSSSCGKYQKILKSTDYEYKYNQAVLYYENDDYNRAMPLFKELSTIFKGTSKIQEVDYYYAYCNYAVGDHLIAAYLFKNYSDIYPYAKHTEECLYMSAYCYYLKAPDYSLDATNTYKAIRELQKFINILQNLGVSSPCN